jgi:hypothetical protein
MIEDGAGGPPDDLVTMRREFDLATATEGAYCRTLPSRAERELTEEERAELQRLRRLQQDLAVAMCAHPYYHQAEPNGAQARTLVMQAAKTRADPATP